MSSREICKYYLHGACRNGASCRFSHSMDAPKSTVCTYYLAGNCAYGDKCRYDHVRPKVRRDHPKIPRASSDARARPAYPDGGDTPRAQRCVDVAGGHVSRGFRDLTRAPDASVPPPRDPCRNRPKTFPRHLLPGPGPLACRLRSRSPPPPGACTRALALSCPGGLLSARRWAGCTSAAGARSSPRPPPGPPAPRGRAAARTPTPPANRVRRRRRTGATRTSRVTGYLSTTGTRRLSFLSRSSPPRTTSSTGSAQTPVPTSKANRVRETIGDTTTIRASGCRSAGRPTSTCKQRDRQDDRPSTNAANRIERPAFSRRFFNPAQLRAAARRGRTRDTPTGGRVPS